MTDYQKLVDFFMDELPEDSPWVGNVKSLVEKLIANGVTIQKWIPVTERLPEKKGNYLGFTGSTFMVGYYKGDAVWWIWAYDREGVDLFTHWMPMPEPPEGE